MTAPPRPSRSRIAGFSAMVIVLIITAIAGPVLQQFELLQLASVVPFAIAVLSMNLLTGITGQISLGQSAFFGTGAYVAGVLVNNQHWPYLASGAAGVAAAGLLGLLVGIPAIRLRGLYVAIATLGVGLAFPDVIQKLQSTTGGSAGLSVATPADPPQWLEVNLTNWTLYLSLTLLAVALLVTWNVRRSPTGRALIAVRDQEVVAETFGVRLASMKLFVFVLSAALAGLGGVVYLIQQQFIAPTSFGLTQSIDFIVGMAIGGQVSVVGALFGGMFLVYAPVESTKLGVPPMLTPVIYGAFLLFFMYFLRAGLAGGCVALWQRFRRRALPQRSGPPGGPHQRVAASATTDATPEANPSPH